MSFEILLETDSGWPLCMCYAGLSTQSVMYGLGEMGRKLPPSLAILGLDARHAMGLSSH